MIGYIQIENTCAVCASFVVVVVAVARLCSSLLSLVRRCRRRRRLGRFLPKRWSYAWFVCLRVNHTIYAFSLCVHGSLLFGIRLRECLCVCARSRSRHPSNVCVMIWFLYQSILAMCVMLLIETAATATTLEAVLAWVKHIAHFPPTERKEKKIDHFSILTHFDVENIFSLHFHSASNTITLF